MAGDVDSISGQNALSLETVETLKAETVSCFNDAFFIKLQDVDQIYGKKNKAVDVGILEVLIRRLKRLAMLQT